MKNILIFSTSHVLKDEDVEKTRSDILKQMGNGGVIILNGNANYIGCVSELEESIIEVSADGVIKTGNTIQKIISGIGRLFGGGGKATA